MRQWISVHTLCINAFQSTHPRGVRHSSLNMAATASDFNPRTHVGCDLFSWGGKLLMLYFNPRTHVGCDLADMLISNFTSDFNPRTHVGCDRRRLRRRRLRRNFNPRTHVGCDQDGHGQHCRSAISIHAPTWGATCGRAPVSHRHPISIHAPTWGATQADGSKLVAVLFQSTHPRGVRLTRWRRLFWQRYFNPRTHVGCDRWRRDLTVRQVYFNPRTHVGCDALASQLNAYFKAFQSTHPRGVRHGIIDRNLSGLEFQSTHPRGVRLLSHQMVGF